MKTLSIRTFVAAAVLALTSFASVAYAQSSKVKVDVPFAFEYAGHAYAAGQYSFTARPDGVVELNGGNQIREAVALRTSMEPVTTAKVVFHHTGDRYYLRQIVAAGSNKRLNFAECKHEKKSRTVNVARNVTTAVVDVDVVAAP